MLKKERPGESEHQSGNTIDQGKQEPSDHRRSMRGFSGIVDRKGRMQFASQGPVRALGYSEEDILGKPFWDAAWFGDSVESRKRVRDSILGALAGKGTLCRVEAFTKNGTSVPVIFNVTPLKGVGSDAVSIVAGMEPLEEATDVECGDDPEEALKKIERRYRAMFDNPLNLVYVADKYGNFIDASDATLKRLGYTRDAIKKLNYAHIAHPDDLQKAYEAHMEIITKGHSEKPLETRLRAASGEEVWVETCGSLVEQDGDRIITLGIARDMTARKRAEAAAASSEQYFRSLIENSSDVVIVVDSAGGLSYQSPAGTRILGSAPEDNVGKSAFDYVHPDDIPRAAEVLGGLLKTPGSIASIDLRLRHADGSWRNTEAVGHNLLEDPAVRGVVINFHDVTERKKAEEARVESDLRYRLIAENIKDAIWLMNTEARLTYVSPASLDILGYTPEEMMAAGSLVQFVAPSSMEMAAKAIMDAMKAGDDLDAYVKTEVGGWGSVEIEFLRKDGSTVWGENRIAILYGADGKAIGYVGVTRNISQQKRVERELRDYQEKLKDALDKLRVAFDQLSTPVVQVWEHVLAIPLIGVVDTYRARQVMEVLLSKIVETQANVVIVDVTGVATMDTQVTNHLIQTAKATRLLGAECVVTGVKPEVAQTMVQIGADMSSLVVTRDLQEGLRYAMRGLAYHQEGSPS